MPWTSPGASRRAERVRDGRISIDPSELPHALEPHDGRDAVAAAAAHRPDIVLLDIGLPELNGYEVAEQIGAEPWGGRWRSPRCWHAQASAAGTTDASALLQGCGDRAGARRTAHRAGRAGRLPQRAEGLAEQRLAHDREALAALVERAREAGSLAPVAQQPGERGRDVEDLRPARLVDVGCGPGVFLARLRDLGVSVSGIDASAIALRICTERGLSARRVDLEHDALPSLDGADTALCLEVGNLIAESAAERCVEMLCSVTRAVAFSAGPPGQGGDRVRNEQPPEYWTEKFRRHGFDCDMDVSLRWRARWVEAGAASWFASNVLVFKRRAVG